MDPINHAIDPFTLSATLTVRLFHPLFSYYCFMIFLDSELALDFLFAIKVTIEMELLNF